MRWIYRPLTPEEATAKERLVAQHKIVPAVAETLVRRGITNAEELHLFLEPKLTDLHDPFLMSGMRSAVDRLNKAVLGKEKILVYGDYDVDGTTAVTLVYKYLSTVVSGIDYYIPDRYNEGNGVSKKGIDFAHENGFTLIITLDCGIKAVEEVGYAKELGIDTIICDHHVTDGHLPEATAVLNPKLPGSGYPFDELSGCGVGFKLMQAFAIENKLDHSQLYDLLDLVVVSIAADTVPIVGENRILAYHGLRVLNHHPGLGIKGVIEISGLRNKTIDISDITFRIGPRLNASGRMTTGRESVDLLLARTPGEAKDRSQHIDQNNSMRRELDRMITHEAKAIVESFESIDDRKVIVVYDPSWHKGVIGIVASRLCERYNRPAIVLTDTSSDDNLVSGSGRSIEPFDLYRLLEQCSETLVNFGGHPYAAGLTIEKGRLHDFIKQVTALADQAITTQSLEPTYQVDAQIDLGEITPVMRRQLKKLAPFGPGNPTPLFMTSGVRCVIPPKQLGKERAHLKLMVSMPDKARMYQAFGYNFGYMMPQLIGKDKPFDMLYTVEEQPGKRNSAAQLLLKDLNTE